MPFGSIILFLGLALDRLIGDPRSRFHPVALLGNLIGFWGRINFYPRSLERVIGILGWLVTVAVAFVPCVLLYLFAPKAVFVIFSILALAFCIGWRSLEEHVASVEEALSKGEEEGRRAVSYLVSRDTKKLTFEQIRSGAYESAAENLVDSIIAPIFWFVVFEIIFGAGIFGAVLFRCANTMDAMLGYKDERIRLGWFAARADDVLAFIPARVTGVLLLAVFAVKGTAGDALRCYQRDRKKRPGFNGGTPMSLIAGGCGVCFEKPGVYRIGDCKRTLEEGGRSIISSMRWATVLAAVALILLMVIL
ncbi:MAG TPA: adenosylcobinamide-phosphate synthase CbiB [Methanocorpusculum sp.]|nr:adenosylcobinamide-phosphate synthase CbiB [Methanocorpusculum sp.]